MNEKREFLKQYVLNRCIGNTGSMDGRSVAGQAEEAWRRIEMLAGGETNSGRDPEIGVPTWINDMLKREEKLQQPNPALENVLEKLREYFKQVEQVPDDKAIRMDMYGGFAWEVMTLGDLRRWVESEKKK
jgi:hypothetical protein